MAKMKFQWLVEIASFPGGNIIIVRSRSPTNFAACDSASEKKAFRRAALMPRRLIIGPEKKIQSLQVFFSPWKFFFSFFGGEESQSCNDRVRIHSLES